MQILNKRCVEDSVGESKDEIANFTHTNTYVYVVEVIVFMKNHQHLTGDPPKTIVKFKRKMENSLYLNFLRNDTWSLIILLPYSLFLWLYY